MLPKKERLTKKEFNRFFSMGRRLRTPLFQVVYAPYPTLHVSVGIPKKIARHAVTRNKIRRRVYEIVRVYHKEHRLAGVYIYLCTQNIATMKHHTVRDAIIEIIQKTNPTS